MKKYIIIALLLIIVLILVYKRIRSDFTPSCWRSCCSKETVQGASGPESVPNMACLQATSLQQYCASLPTVTHEEPPVDTGNRESDGNIIYAPGDSWSWRPIPTDPGCGSDPTWTSVVNGTAKPWVQEKQCGVYFGQSGFEGGSVFPASFDDKDSYCKYVKNADPCCTYDLHPGGPTPSEIQASRDAGMNALVQQRTDAREAYYQGNRDTFIGKGCRANADAGGITNFDNYCGVGCDAGWQDDPCCAERNAYARSADCYT